jgi:hypothetical protein
LCFFAGYFAGNKSRHNGVRYYNPYKVNNIPRRIAPRIPKIPANLPVINRKNLQNRPNVLPKPAKTKTAAVTAAAQNKK